MPPKIGPFSLGMAIAMVLNDKGPMTKEQCFDIFKPLEITNREFDEAWKELRSWGQIYSDFTIDESGKDIYNFRADSPHMERYVPELWEHILGDTPKKKYTLELVCKEMHKDRVLEGIKSVPGILEVKYKYET